MFSHNWKTVLCKKNIYKRLLRIAIKHVKATASFWSIYWSHFQHGTAPAKAVQFQIGTSALRGVLGKGRDILFLGCIFKILVNLNSITIGIQETRPGPLSQSALYGDCARPVSTH
jgi:hypothetical protein